MNEPGNKTLLFTASSISAPKTPPGLKQLLTATFAGLASCPLPPFESFYFIVRTVTRSGTF